MSQTRKMATKPELIVRHATRSLGVGYRLNRRDLPGTPNLAFIGRKKVIFVHGCFWHQRGCPLTGKAPATRVDYWAPKLRPNVERDAEVAQRLTGLGYSIQTNWECEVRAPDLIDQVRSVLDIESSCILMQAGAFRFRETDSCLA